MYKKKPISLTFVFSYYCTWIHLFNWKKLIVTHPEKELHVVWNGCMIFNVNVCFNWCFFFCNSCWNRIYFIWLYQVFHEYDSYYTNNLEKCWTFSTCKQLNKVLNGSAMQFHTSAPSFIQLINKHTTTWCVNFMCAIVCWCEITTTGNNWINFRHECFAFNDSVRTSLSELTPQVHFVFTHFTNSTNAQQNFHKRFLVLLLLLLLWFHMHIRITYTIHIRFMKPTKAERQQAKRQWNQIKFHKVMRKKSASITYAYVCERR